MDTIQSFLPLTYVIDFMQGIFNGEALHEYGFEIMMIAGLCLLCSVVWFIYTKRKIERPIVTCRSIIVESISSYLQAVLERKAHPLRLQ